jgi:prepilin-type processing-associated H-X9-DG protein
MPSRKTNVRPVNGFSGVDLLVVLAVLSVLAVIVLVPVTSMKRKARLAVCTGNLEQVTRALLLYTEDYRKTLPVTAGGPPGDLWWWYKELLMPYVKKMGVPDAGGLFACPDDRGYSDPKPFFKTPRFDYGSYVYNGVTLPGMPNVAGWQISSVVEPKRTLAVMEWTAHAPLSWHDGGARKANTPFYCDARSVVGFVDGHVSFTKIYYDGYNAAFTRDPIAGYEYKYSGN